MPDGVKMKPEDTFAHSILDSIPDHIAVLDPQGRIVAVNASWLRFAAESGAPSEFALGPGIDYLAVCEKAISAGDATALAASEGIREVMGGRNPEFTLEYACARRTGKAASLRGRSPSGMSRWTCGNAG